MNIQNKEQRSLWYKKIFYYLKSGQSLPESVKTAATDIDTRLLYEELSDGSRFSDVCSLSDFQKVFSKTEVSLLRVAEQTGNMQSVCAVLGDMLKEQYEQSQKLVAAMIYPILVLCMACGLLLMILTVVVPKIGPLFISMKHIPIATQILIVLSDHVVRLWYIDIIDICIMFVILLYLKKKTRYFSYIQNFLPKIYIHTPYLKDIYILWFISRWMQVTHLSLKSNASLVQSLGFAGQSISDVYINTQFTKVTALVAEGNSCSDSLQQLSGVLKKRLQDWISIIASGEKTGTLEEVFQVSHEYIASHLQESFNKFQKVIEPLLIVLVGIMVLCICLAIILPMYQLTQSIQ